MGFFTVNASSVAASDLKSQAEQEFDNKAQVSETKESSGKIKFTDNLAFQPRLFAGAAHLSHIVEGKYDDVKEGEPTTPLNGEGGDRGAVEISDNVALIGIGGTLVYKKRFYLDAYFQQLGDGNASSYFSNPDVPITDTRSRIDIIDASQVDSRRYDYGITLGYVVNKNWSVFTGYKAGTTKLTDNHKVTSNDFNIDTGVTTSNPERFYEYKSEFKAGGPFIGTAYGWRIGKGLLGLNLGWAYLSSGSYKYTLPGYPPLKPEIKPTSGLTLGISWKGMINKNWLYGISADAYQYKMDLDEAEAALGGGNLGNYKFKPLNIEEKIYTLKFNLIYRF